MRTLALALALVPGVALAQSNVPEDIGERPVAYKPVEEHEFDDVYVDANGVRPGIALTQERVPQAHKSLVVLRANFNPEMDASVGEVR